MIPRVAAATVITCLAFAAPGLADTNLGTANGVTYVLDQSPVAVDQQAAVLAECPPGSELLGAGADSVSGQPEGVLSSLRPEDGDDANGRPDDAVTAFAHNTSTMAGSTQVWAFCAPGKVRYPSRSLKVPRRDTRAVKVPCPRGTRVLSGGAYLDGLNDEVRLNALRPYDDGDKGKLRDDGWQVKASNVEGGRKQMTAWAFCRKGVKPSYESAAAGLGPDTAAGAGLACPDLESSLLGTGGAIGGFGAARWITAVVPDDNTSPGEPDAIPDDVLVLHADNNTGTPTTYRPHTICGDLGV